MNHFANSVCTLLICLLTADGLGAPVSAQDETAVREVTVQSSATAPIVIAHRGASGYLPEHTLEAAVLAHAQAAEYIEQDVVLSRDGVAVVLHDVTLDAVTDVADAYPDRRAEDGHFYAADFSWEELQQLRVTERTGFKRRDPSTRFPAGVGQFRIATLRQHLALIAGLNQSRNRDVGVYVEIKKPGWHRARGLDPSREVLRILQEHGYVDRESRVFLQCFEFDEIRRLRAELHTELPLVQLLSQPPSQTELDQYARFADGLGVSLKCLVQQQAGREPEPADLVEQAHQRTLVVHAWTVRTDDLPSWCNSTEELLDLLVGKCGVDGLFCDQPDVAVQWRSSALSGVPISGPFRLLNGQPAERKTAAGKLPR
jgi:glycerophosphoryl diester phosphodiesterase